MRILNATPLRLGCFSYRPDPGVHRLGVLVKGAFAIEHGSVARLLEAQPPLCGDEPFDDEASARYPSDFAPYKPRADVMVIGTFHHPAGASRGVGRATLRVGRMQKALAVIGERHWDGHKQSEPKPFRSMPLRYERAFGGEGYTDNPVGMGFVADPSRRAPLPHVELADRLIKTPLDRPAPAGFGPIDRCWSSRTSKMGTYDRRWLAERWPCFPTDFDWSYFNAAPSDQQPPFLKGDEEVLCEGLHPRVPAFETRLPGLRPRAFLRRFRAADEEVALSLDTLWIDMDACELVLVWRGSAAIKTKRHEEVDGALCVLESLADAPQPAATYADASYWEPPPPRAEEGEPEIVEQLEPEPPPEPEVSEEQLIDDMRKMLKERECPPEILDKLEGVKTLAALQEVIDKQEPQAKNDLNEEIDKVIEQTIADARAAIGPDGNIDDLKGQPEPPEPEPGMRLTREEVAARYTAGQSLEGMDLSGVDLSGLDLSKADLKGAKLVKSRLSSTILAGATLSDADFSGASAAEAVDLSDANLERARLEGASLPAADFTGADLSSATLKGAKLPAAIFERALVQQADFSGADLTGARASEARLPAATLAGANLTGAVFVRADLAQADLKGAIVDRAILVEAELTSASLRGASMRAVNATGASLREVDLSDADLSEAIFERAELTGSILDRARLDRASLREASLERARGEAVALSTTDMTGARASQSSFPRGLFDGVKADDSIWIGAELGRARFAEASLERANFMEADLTEAVFHRAVLKSARLDSARLGGALLTKVNLFRGSLDSADLTGADCRGSNFFECELLDAVLTKARFERSNIGRTLLERPAPGEPPPSTRGAPPTSRRGGG